MESPLRVVFFFQEAEFQTHFTIFSEIFLQSSAPPVTNSDVRNLALASRLNFEKFYITITIAVLMLERLFSVITCLEKQYHRKKFFTSVYNVDDFLRTDNFLRNVSKVFT